MLVSFVTLMCVYWFFFFSSRRRHTRLQGDWSSDVCSSDLAPAPSVTVTLTVKVFGKITTYVCPFVNEPSLETVPVEVDPSPQLILYDQGPLWLASVKLHWRL